MAKHCLLLAAQETMTASAAAGLAVLACGSAAGDRKPAESQDADAAGVAGCTGNDAAATLLAKAQAATAASDVKVTQCHADVQQLYQHVKQKMDTATAHMLHVSASCLPGRRWQCGAPLHALVRGHNALRLSTLCCSPCAF